MALYVNTNVSSINAQRKLTNATNSLNVSYQRLASGFRINSAKDDAAGLMISDRLTSQINGLNQGNRNANDGIALAQTIEGALDETTNMLQRSKEDRLALQQEVTQLCAEINRIASDTTFAGKLILDGANSAQSKSLIPSSGIMTFHVGSNQGDTISLNWEDPFSMDGIATAAGLSAAVTAINAFTTTTVDGVTKTVWNVKTQSTSETVIGQIDKFIQYVDKRRSELGAIQNRMEATIRNQANISENESDARSRIRDTDFASETAALTQNNIIQQASQTVLAQANQRPTIALSLLGS